MKTDSRLYILTGQIGEGKTTLLEKWATNQRNVYGLLTPRTGEGRVFKIIETGEEWPMQKGNYRNDDILIGQHRFSLEAFVRANSYLKTLKQKEKGLFIIDEYGKLENKQNGLWEGISSLLTDLSTNPEFCILLVVRSSLCSLVANSLKIPPSNILTISNFSDEIKGILKA